MDADAIQIVSRALQERLVSAFAAQGIRGDVFVGPVDDRNADGAAAILFLYRIALNSDLRNSEHVVQPQNAGKPARVYEGGLPLDLFYLLTAGTSQTGGELNSLRVLGVAMQALNDTPDLVGVPVRGEIVRLTLDPVSSEEMSRIWTLFPTANYRTSVIYLASPVWIDPTLPRIPGPPVTQEPHRMWQIGPEYGS